MYITVVAPIVSQACIFLTRLFVASIRLMLSARLSVTLIGRPSGTLTTISVTASIIVVSRYSMKPIHSNPAP